MAKKTKSKMKPRYTYEIGVPISEYWIMEVEADSYREALDLIRNQDSGVTQVYSLAAPLGRKKPKLFEKRRLKNKT